MWLFIFLLAGTGDVVIPVDLGHSNINKNVEKGQDSATTALLEDSLPLRQKRYGTSEFKQFWIVLKRTLLFSRRDWVISISNFSFSYDVTIEHWCFTNCICIYF